jgi:hypothetical protein
VSSRTTNQNESSTDYIDKYLKSMILNGQLQLLNTSGNALYKFQGSDILDDINVILPLLSGDDTFAFQNFNNEFGGVQTFNQGMVSQGGLLMLEDPEGILDDDITLFDGININVGTDTGSVIATSPTQMLAFFGSVPTTQPLATDPNTASLVDLWNMAVSLGLISANQVSTITATNYESFLEIVAPANPASGTRILYVDSTSHAISSLDSTGTIHNLESPTIPVLFLKGLFTANGGSSSYSIPHGMSTTPTCAMITGANTTSKDDVFVASIDATNINITFGASISSGTNNCQVYWTAFV